MNSEKEAYINKLIGEEIGKLLNEGFIPRKNGNAAKTKVATATADSDIDDDFDDTDNIFAEPAKGTKTIADVDFSKQPKGRHGGDAYMAAKTSLPHQLDRMRKNLPYDAIADDNGNNANGNPSVIHQALINQDVKLKSNRYNRDDRDPNILGRIQVAFTHKEPNTKYNNDPNGYGILTLFNIDPKDVENLWEKCGKGETTRGEIGYSENVHTAATRINYGKDAVTFIIYDKYLDKWKEEELPFVLNYLKSCVDDKGKPKYGDDKTFNSLSTEIAGKIYTAKDETEYYSYANNNLAQKYQEYLTSEDNEVINAIIALYQRGGAMDYLCKDLKLPESYGHRLAWKNASTIISSGRKTLNGNAPTFVLPEATWRRRFGRVVKPGATKFFVQIPDTRNWKGVWKNDRDIYYPYKDSEGNDKTALLRNTQDILNTFYDGKSFDQLTKQEQHRVNVLANRHNPAPSAKKMFRLVEYDVDDTIFDPNLAQSLGINGDIFNEEAGLLSNLRLILNQAAQDDLNNRLNEPEPEEPKQDTEEDDNPSNKNAIYGAMINKTEYQFRNVQDYAKDQGIDIRSKEVRNDPSASLINSLLYIGEKIFPRTQGVIKPTLFKEILDNAVYFVCRLECVALDQVATLRNPIKGKLTMNDVLSFNNLLNELIDIVEGVKTQELHNVVAESNEEVNNTNNIKWSDRKQEVAAKAKKFLMKLSAEGQTEQLYEMLNRMDASKKNLL